jgi:hypothetical protein
MRLGRKSFYHDDILLVYCQLKCISRLPILLVHCDLGTPVQIAPPAGLRSSVSNCNPNEGQHTHTDELLQRKERQFDGSFIANLEFLRSFTCLARRRVNKPRKEAGIFRTAMMCLVNLLEINFGFDFLPQVVVRNQIIRFVSQGKIGW